jgi:transposase
MRGRPHRLIFLDETSVKTNLTRLHGRTAKGKRLRADAPFGKWQTQTFIAGLKLDGIVAPFVVQGAMNGTVFDTYVRELLAPAVGPGDIVVLDNLNLHKSPRAAAALAERGAWFLFLPRYSPDLNPIEMAFAKLKARLRAGAHRTVDYWRGRSWPSTWPYRRFGQTAPCGFSGRQRRARPTSAPSSEPGSPVAVDPASAGPWAS